MRKSFILALIWTICFVIGTVIGANAGDQKAKEKQEAINSYIGNNYTPRARYTRESEGHGVWHTIEELNRQDEQQRLIDRNFIINKQGEKIKI